MKQKITASRLRELLSYDPETGIFTRNIKWGSRGIGDIPGTKSPQGYWYIGLDKGTYPAHRLAWLYVHGTWPDGDIDHINRNRLDNRIVNLRMTTRSTNLHNSGSRGSSGVKGVSMISPSRRAKSKKLWQARIQVNNEEYDLGSYYTLEEATAARKFAEQLLIPV